MTRPPTTTQQARRIGIRLDFKRMGKKEPNFLEFKQGLDVEREHGSKLGADTNVTKDNPVTEGKIALAHLKERGQERYYSDLKQMEERAKKRAGLAKACSTLRRLAASRR